MTIRYNNGQAIEAVLLSRIENEMRVALQGSDDVIELKEVHGVWISEECEPVNVEFAWARQQPKPMVTEADCVCSHEAAARLIHLLFSGENAPVFSAPGARRAIAGPAMHHVI